MTSRRSGQPWTQRVSRAQQFRPGHVSGRVASAQPIRRYYRIGGTAKIATAAADASVEQQDGASPEVVEA